MIFFYYEFILSLLIYYRNMNRGVVILLIILVIAWFVFSRRNGYDEYDEYEGFFSSIKNTVNKGFNKVKTTKAFNKASSVVSPIGKGIIKGDVDMVGSGVLKGTSEIAKVKSSALKLGVKGATNFVKNPKKFAKDATNIRTVANTADSVFYY
jgi:hypothetical protein